MFPCSTTRPASPRPHLPRPAASDSPSGSPPQNRLAQPEPEPSTDEPLWGLDTFASPPPANEDTVEEPLADPPALTECLRHYGAGIISLSRLLRCVHDVIRDRRHDWRLGLRCIELLMRCTHRETGALVCPSATEVGVVLAALARVNRATEALDLLHLLETFGPPNDRFPSAENYTSAMAACVNARRPLEALALFDRVVPPAGACPPTVAMLELAMAACLKKNLADRALALFDRHVAESATRPDLLPRLTTYAGAMAVCRRASRLGDMLRLLDHLLLHGPAHGLHPNFLVCNTAVAACEEAGMHSLSQRLLAWAIGAGILLDTLGLDPVEKVLDLHAGAVAGPEAGYYGRGGATKGVSVGMARAIFAFHRQAGTLGPDARIVVGKHGQGLLQAAMVRCIWEAGCYPVVPEIFPGRFFHGCLEMRRQPPFAWRGPQPQGPWSAAAPVPEPV